MINQGPAATTVGLKLWAKNNMRVCPLCGRKYIKPHGGRGRPGMQYYRSERKRPDICWRCEDEINKPPAEAQEVKAP